MRIDHISFLCKVGELDKVTDYYKQLGFEVYKKTTLRGLRAVSWSTRRTDPAR